MRVTLVTLVLLFSAPALAQDEDPVQATIREFHMKYPLDERQPVPHVPSDEDEAPPGYRPTSEEVETYAAWLQMLTRRAARAASTRWERNCAGHAREELRKGRKWLAIGQEAERHRGSRPPRRNPISMARRIDSTRVDHDPEHVSAYRIALAGMHRGARYALAVFKAHGLDPEREPVEEEPPKKKRDKLSSER